MPHPKINLMPMLDFVISSNNNPRLIPWLFLGSGIEAFTFNLLIKILANQVKILYNPQKKEYKSTSKARPTCQKSRRR